MVSGGDADLKHIRILLIILLLTQGVLLPVSAVCPETESIPHDGYLIKLAEYAPVPLSSRLEYVAPNIYWTADGELAEDFAKYGAAELVEPNYQVTLFDLQEPVSGENLESTLPWAYTALKTDVAEAWGLSGAGVRIAVIDSGLQTGNNNLDHAVIAPGYDYTTESSTMTDTVGHGTHVIQMIAGDGDSGMMKGIAPGATIVPLRCFSEKTTSSKVLIRAIEDAADPEKFDCDIINMSWGYTTKSTLMTEALQRARDAGVILVAAAGNVQTGMPQGSICYPAALDTVVGVGAVETESKAAAVFSQQTKAVDVCAPGQLIPVCSIENVKTKINGTSFATPCVSAIFALILEAAPEAGPEFAEKLLYKSVEDLGEVGRDDAYGYGFTDISGLFSSKAWMIDKCQNGSIGYWVPAEVHRTVYTSFYNDDGKMISLMVLSLADNSLWGSCRLQIGTPFKQVRGFVLTEDMIPLIEVFEES